MGFTIVELLVVIVVIAILAVITIVSYNGIQDRAINSSTMSAVLNIEKLIELYIVNNDAYPLTSGGSIGSCSTADTASCSVAGSSKGTNNTYITNMTTVGTLPAEPARFDSSNYGIFYQYNAIRTVDGIVKPTVLIWYLKGTNVSCGRTVLNGSTLNNNYTTASNPYSASSGGTTTCIKSINGP